MPTAIALAYLTGALYQVWRTRGSPSLPFDLVAVLLCTWIVVRADHAETALIGAILLWLVCSVRRYRVRREPPVPGCEIVRTSWTSSRS
jgi:hypothetical protein